MSTVVVTMSRSVVRRSLDTVKLATSVAAGVAQPVVVVDRRDAGRSAAVE
jgi:hypothetical protein